MNLDLRRRLVFLAWLLLLASCAATPSVSPQARADLAPTGKLRAGINYADAIMTINGRFSPARQNKTGEDQVVIAHRSSRGAIRS